ncbi:hypothetical protein AYO49_05000 [Verrucomicrobiaceae bacterium SCGC AG-212-N21]|nr:hypothetical protein AYO49_05000 [Verrucomicrobiaceae bacterium SCGC AG-212-N21]
MKKARQGHDSRWCKSLLAAALLLTLPSCVFFPHRELIAPRTTGAVINAHTHKPIADCGVEYHYQSATKIGEARTRSDGGFTIPKKYQWFYLVYLGSPGEYPMPYRYYGLGNPDCLVVTTPQGERQVFMLGDPKTHLAGNESIKRHFRAPRGAEWIGSHTGSVLRIAPGQKTQGMPHMDHSRWMPSR